MNQYRSGRRLVPLADRPDILPNWSVIFSGQSTEDTIPDMEFGTKQYTYFVIVIYYQNLLKGGETMKLKRKTCVNTEYEWEKMAAALTLTLSHY